MSILRKIACAVVFTIGAAGIASAQHSAVPVIELTAGGEIQIAPDGHVSDYLLKTHLAPAVAQALDHAVRSWHFEPIAVDGRAVAAKTTMTIQLHGEPKSGGDTYSLSVSSVHFGVLTKAKQVLPEYPYDAVQARLGARVVLHLQIDADGNVVQALPGQTSLTARARSEHEAELWRRRFEKASIAAALQWHYDPSESIDGKPMANRYAIAPIVFGVRDGPSDPGPQGWVAYVPGPVHPAPWDEAVAAGDDQQRFAQLSNGETASANSNFRLKDDVIGKTL
jgi:hypothetical protein